NLLNFELILFMGVILMALGSIFVFYKILIKTSTHPDKEIKVNDSKKQAGHFKYILGSLSPFILFIITLISDKNISNVSAIVGSIFFTILAIILIFREESGILYNIFYLPYNILEIATEKGSNILIITKKDNLYNYVKVKQLNRKVFKEWN
ncbi:unnamed protein product, partial [marine sediment metagenome]